MSLSSCLFHPVTYHQDLPVSDQYQGYLVAATRFRPPNIPTFSLHHSKFQRAERENVDLVVICTRGQSGLGRWLIGSVADRVARDISVPVLLILSKKDGDDIE